MYLIEPCCSHKHLLRVRDAIKDGGTTQFEGYGDMSLAELLPALMTRYSETKMVIVAPTIPDQAAEAIGKAMRRRLARIDGTGNMDVIRHLTIISDLDKRWSPLASTWTEVNPFGERLTLIGKYQTDTVILLPDFAITGPMNMRYGKHFVASATTDKERIADLWKKYQQYNT